MAQISGVTAGQDSVSVSLTLQQAEVLGVFSTVGAVKSSDQFLIITANQNGTVSATKATAEVVRAYLNKGFEITVDAQGNLYIGGVAATALNNKIDGIETTVEGDLSSAVTSLTAMINGVDSSLSSALNNAIAAERQAREAGDTATQTAVLAAVEGVYYSA